MKPTKAQNEADIIMHGGCIYCSDCSKGSKNIKHETIQSIGFFIFLAALCFYKFNDIKMAIFSFITVLTFYFIFIYDYAKPIAKREK